MKCVLMVAEKPKLAASLASILSNGKCTTRKASNNACSVHEWTGTFNNSQVQFKMTSVCGHVMSLDFPGKYNSWDKVDPVELFTCPTEKREAAVRLKIPQFLAQEARNCQHLVLWLDCDKEGENICFEVMNAVKNTINGDVFTKTVTYRARFSAITDKDIKSAMTKLVYPNENESRSVDARQELDLRIGCAFTRFQTKFFHGRYGNLDASLISYGPCQTPTLAFCVARHDQIQSFKPEPFWYVSVIVANDGKSTTLEWKRVRVFDKDVALMFYNHVRTFDVIKCVDIASKEKTKQRPQALNTVELMRVASSSLNIGPQQAMQIAEHLYTAGFISYPRTETTAYSENFDFHAVLAEMSKSNVWGEAARELKNDFVRPRKGTDVGDHPPITPTRNVTRDQLDASEWLVYDLIARHFLATISRDCKYTSVTAVFHVGDDELTDVFTCTGVKVVDAGFTKFTKTFGDGVLPNFTLGQTYPMDVRFVESHTNAPDYLTESELITLMETHGIGTDASISVHINNITQRNYVTVSTGRRLVPTPLGIVLIHGYQKIDSDLILPTTRAAVEKQLNLIAMNRADFHDVLHHTLEVFRQKFLYFVKTIAAMDQLFDASFSPISLTAGRAMSRCGKCRRYMKFIQTRPQRLHCAVCDETYNVPQNASIRAYHEKCPLDEFEVLICQYAGGAKGKSFVFCPYCYNYAPFADMKANANCSNCEHPTCALSYVNTGVASCLSCQVGVLTLDLSSTPKWKMTCNKCEVIVNLFEDALRVRVEKAECECGAHLIGVTYKDGKSRLSGGGVEWTGCVFCCDDVSALIDIHKTKAMPVKMAKSRAIVHGKGRKVNKRPKAAKDKMSQLAAYFV